MITGHTDAAIAREQLVLLDIRLPRLLLGAFVGSALAVSGAMMQGMFRNPLADPGLVGVSSGAALTAVATIALGNGLATPWAKAFGVYALPISAFCGGVATTAVLVGIVSRQGQLATSTLLLAGIALGALSTALMGLIAFASDDRELRDLTLWMLGSLSGASWPKVAAIVPFLSDRVEQIQQWSDVKLLTVTVDRLRQWYRPGLLCIGDAAHAMSPVGGVGINLAVQDAVAAANILSGPLARGACRDSDLARVQKRRELPTRVVQRVQLLAQDLFLKRTLEGRVPRKMPVALRLLQRFPILRRIPARLVGMGIRPEHIATRTGN